MLGCIPVVIQPSVIQAFEGDLLDWEEFAIFLQVEDIPNIVSILRAIPPETLEAKQEGCKRVWTRFAWTSPAINPLKSHPQKVQDEWAPILAETDVLASLMEALQRRVEGKDKKGSWLGGANLEDLEGVPYGGDLRRREKTGIVNAENVAEKTVDPSAGPPPSKCPDACSENGFCNEELGVCYCLANFAGPTCSEHAMPSCYLAPNYFTPCPLMGTCACKVECQSYRFTSSHTCFDEKRDGGKVERDIGKLLEGPQAMVHFAGLAEGGRSPVHEGAKKMGLTHPDECNMCSGRGVCNKEHKNCGCVWRHGGRYCEHNGDIPLDCFNGCSGRGECVEGSCKCQRGSFGMDCSLFVDGEGKTRILERPPFLQWSPQGTSPLVTSPSLLRPRIYVYDLPGYFNTWQFLHSFYLDWQEQVFFLERLLASPYRTANGEEADFFYIPLILRNRLWQKNEVLEWSIQYISDKWPFYKRKNGADHIVMTNDDWGNCEIGPRGIGAPLLDPLITITLWGQTKNAALEDKNPCFKVGKDIVMPPRMDPNVYNYIPALKEDLRVFLATPEGATWVSPDRGPDPRLFNRTTLLYFKGWPAFTAQTHGPFTWSFGVRQKMFQMYGGKENETGIRMVGTEGVVWGFLEEMESSIFCLAPSGWGWGMRATQAAMLGCIPVVIQPGVIQALEGDLLDWEEFGIKLTVDDIPNIEKILRAVPNDVIEAKRRACAEVWTRFAWASASLNPLEKYPKVIQDKWAKVLAEKDAFASLVDALGRRVSGQKQRR
eukprot:TRINITY_DN5097_c0_g1_i1.p1 TRINITY_DN5097_c0_g1~~TRINITY_DN5097_c0_g1_i1.p1  ORF type:complete len:809 (-),score=113.99 TRINITY_DN5097_c0_g1_i1:232-2547(-)